MNPAELPSSLFDCHTLKVLKLDVNLYLGDVMPLCLPNLKVLHISLFRIHDGDIVTRLVSSCPSLVDLSVKAEDWKDANAIKISAPSLRKLVIITGRDFERTEVVLDTPKLEYLHFSDAIALRYSIKDLNNLAEALIDIFYYYASAECGCGSILGLVRQLSNAQRLTLSHGCVEAVDDCKPPDRNLPVFYNLKNLQLGLNGSVEWRNILLDLLNCSPFLETLAFPEGISRSDFDDEYRNMIADSESEYWSSTKTIPSCLGSHLREIVIEEFTGIELVLEMLKYFLRNALVLESLIIIVCEHSMTRDYRMSMLKTLQELNGISSTCVIRIQ